MALPGVSIIVGNGGLGRVPANSDRVVGIVMNGMATANISIGESKQLFSLEDAVAVGITAAYDTANAVKVYEHIDRYYQAAGKGSELWVMLVSQAVNMTTMLSPVQQYAKKLLEDAQGRIRVLGVVRNPAATYVPVVSDGMDNDANGATQTGQLLGDEFAAQFQPVRILIDGYAFNSVAASLMDLNTYTKNRVGILIGGAFANHNSMGLLLGKVASIPVHRNIGCVKDGSLPLNAAFVGTLAVKNSVATAIHNKGFITFRAFPRRAGYYFANDPMAALVTDDYKSLHNGRTIDKVITIAYDVFVQELLDNVALDASGKIAVGQAKYYENLIESAINGSMTTNGEINRVACFVDVAQNVLATGKVCLELRVQPLPSVEEICINLGFAANLS